MERNKSDEYTFGVDEKETLDKLFLKGSFFNIFSASLSIFFM